MGDWLSFLVFAGLFYVMMRYGCGAHMVHGKQNKHKVKEKDVDQVCGMKVDDDQGYGKMHEGLLYRFCSRTCLDKFEIEPGKYLKQTKSDGGDI